MFTAFRQFRVKLISFLPSFLPYLKKNKTVLLISLFFITGFFMRTLIAEDIENEKEIALLESIETRIETKLTTMENEKHRQDTIMMVADEIERLSDNIPEMSNDTLTSLRAIAMTYVDPLADVTTNANEEKKSIEKETEEKLLGIAESEIELRQQIAIDSIKRIELVMIKRLEDINEITKKRNDEMLIAVPEQLKEKFKIFVNPDMAPQTTTQAPAATSSN